MAITFVSNGGITTGSTTLQPTAPSGMVPGNLLVAIIGGNQASNLGQYTIGTPGSTTWTFVDGTVSATPFCRSEIWYTICASSSDTMPIWGNNSTLFAGTIAQFSGTVGFDQHGSVAGTTSPKTVTASGTDTGPGRLIVYGRYIRANAAAVNTTSTDNVNSQGVGAGLTVLADQSASATGHLHAGYTLSATTGGSADNDVATWTMVTNASALSIASFGPTILFAPGGREPFFFEPFDDDPYATWYSIRRHGALPLNPVIQGPGGTAFDDQQDIFYPGWELFNYLHRHLPADLFPPPVLTFTPLHHEPTQYTDFDPDPYDQLYSTPHRRYLEVLGKAPDPRLSFPRGHQTPYDVFEPDPYETLYTTVHRRYFDKTDRISVPRAHTPLDAFGMEMPWDDWVSLYGHRRYLETQVQPADPKLPFPPHHTPLDSFGMDQPWDDWPLFQRNAMHRQAQFPVPYNFPLRREQTPQDGFGFDSPWDDWVSLYAHRRYVETSGKPPDPKLPLPRAKTPPDAFGFDQPWDEWVSLYQHRRYLETKTKPVDLKLPTPPHKTPYEVFEDDPYQTWYSHVHRRFQTGADFFLPRRAQPFVQIHQWDEWVDLYAQPGPRRSLAIPGPAPQGPGGTAFVDPLDLFYPPWDFWPYRERHIGFLPPGVIPPPPPPPVLGPPGKMERSGTRSLHMGQGNQITRHSVSPLHGQQGNQLQRTPVNPLHKQTQ